MEFTVLYKLKERADKMVSIDNLTKIKEGVVGWSLSLLLLKYLRYPIVYCVFHRGAIYGFMGLSFVPLLFVVVFIFVPMWRKVNITSAYEVKKTINL